MKFDVVVEHPSFGIGEISEISLEMDDPLIFVRWRDGGKGCYWAEELEFVGIRDVVGRIIR